MSRTKLSLYQQHERTPKASTLCRRHMLVKTQQGLQPAGISKEASDWIAGY